MVQIDRYRTKTNDLQILLPYQKHTQAALDLLVKHLPHTAMTMTVHDDRFYLLEIHDWATFITTTINLLEGWDLTDFMVNLKPYND
jgi:hypothetical protein